MRDMEGLTEAQMQTMPGRQRFKRTTEKQGPSAGQQTNDSGLPKDNHEEILTSKILKIK